MEKQPTGVMKAVTPAPSPLFKPLFKLFLALLLALATLHSQAAAAPAAPAAPSPTPTVEQRLATLEAYVANTDPGAHARRNG